MNSKQFISSASIYLFEKYKYLKIFFGGLANFFYPSFERFAIFQFIKSKLRKRSLIGIYVFIFVFLFCVQAVWAFYTGRFYIDNDILTKNFLEDWVDIVNYTIICEIYIILGLEFLLHKYFIFSSLKESKFLPESFIPKKNKFSNLYGLALIFIIATFSSIGYTNEVNSYTHFYWFMATPPPEVTFAENGFYYLFVNQLLMLFVIFVAANHLGLFNISSQLVSEIDKILNNDKNKLVLDTDEQLKEWADDNLMKQRLLPFSKLILLSKAFVFVITINLLLWKYNQPQIKPMYELSVLVVAFFGIWVFAIPRYHIQYKIFLLLGKLGRNEYKDLRMPWIIGASAAIDVILISILIKTLMSDTISTLINDLFS